MNINFSNTQDAISIIEALNQRGVPLTLSFGSVVAPAPMGKDYNSYSERAKRGWDKRRANGAVNRGRRKMTDAEKTAHSERMKALWAKRRNDAEAIKRKVGGDLFDPLRKTKYAVGTCKQPANPLDVKWVPETTAKSRVRSSAQKRAWETRRAKYGVTGRK